MAFFRKLFWPLRDQWQIHYFWPLLLFVPLFWFSWRDPFRTHVESGEPVLAEITQIGVERGRYDGATPGLVVRAGTEDGAAGSIIVSPAKVAGCKVGNQISAEKVGFKLYLKPEPCLPNGDLPS